MADKITPEERDLIEAAMHRKQVIPPGVTAFVEDVSPLSATVNKRITGIALVKRNAVILRRLQAGHRIEHIAKDYGLSVGHVRQVTRGKMRE